MKKKLIKFFIVLFIITFTFYFNSFCIAGLADYTDEEAKEINDNQMKQQNETHTDVIGKSSDNYLKSLTVNGYKLTPEFDKQTINYVIQDEVNNDEIVIEAEAENDKAKIQGIGKVNLLPGENNIKIDVIAENGVMRSYFINVTNSSKNIENTVYENSTNNAENLNNIEDTYINDINSNSVLISTKKNNKNKFLICIALLIVIFLIIYFIINSKKHKSKH